MSRSRIRITPRPASHQIELITTGRRHTLDDCLPMANNGKKVVVAMSGGVDSSVAAALLLRQGYDVIGVFMRLGSPQGVESEAACDSGGKNKQGCCSVLDAADARRVAGVLGIPFYVLNFEQDFGRVIDYFVAEYNRGRTPNPCVRCNDWLKFGKLAKYAEAIGADFVASGHYARIGIDPVAGEKALLRGKDHRKDQSYVLFGMNRATIEHTLLPIGEFEKQDVRALAQEMNLPVYNKPDSQEICFVPNQDYAALVQRRSPQTFREGELVDASGNVVGQHDGHQHFTIGQRKGVGVAFGYPVYVVDIDANENRVTLGQQSDLLRSSLVANQINILSARLLSPSPGTPEDLRLSEAKSRPVGSRGEGSAPKDENVACVTGVSPVLGTARTGETPVRQATPSSFIPDRSGSRDLHPSSFPTEFRCQAKIRYNHPPQPAVANVTGPDQLTVRFDHPQPAITPGQAVVLYDGDIVLAGGWIDSAA